MSAEPVMRAARAGDAGPAADIGVRARDSMWKVRRGLLGDEIHDLAYGDVVEAKRRSLKKLVGDNLEQTLVAEVDGRMVGFLCWSIWANGQVGEILEVTVDPDCHGRGIGTALCRQALRLFGEKGCPTATVKTGGDDGHAVARKLYEKLGFGPRLPWVQYFRKLNGESCDAG